MNRGPDIGLTLFIFLTGLAVERATSRRSRSFLAWFVGGAVLPFAVGATLYSI